METNKKALKLYFGIVILASAVLEGLIIYTGQMGIAAILMWIPALAAVVSKYVYFRGEKHALLFKKCKVKYLLYALLLPMIYLTVPYIIYWSIRPGTMQVQWGVRVAVTVIVGTLISMVTALGEEIGWRGFMVPRMLTVFGLEKTLLLSGLIWGLWHCPILISGIYMPGTPVWFKVPMFLIIIGSSGVIIGILTLRSRSVWPAALMHAAHNNYDQVILGAGTSGADKMYYVSETGIITAVVAVILAVILYLSYKKQYRKEQQSNE